MASPASPSFPKHFATLRDPRPRRGTFGIASADRPSSAGCRGANGCSTPTVPNPIRRHGTPTGCWTLATRTTTSAAWCWARCCPGRRIWCAASPCWPRPASRKSSAYARRRSGTNWSNRRSASRRHGTDVAWPCLVVAGFPGTGSGAKHGGDRTGADVRTGADSGAMLRDGWQNGLDAGTRGASCGVHRAASSWRANTDTRSARRKCRSTKLCYTRSRNA